MRLSQRVGQKNVQALPSGHGKSTFGAGDFEGKLQMTYRVWRHQKFESEQTRQKVLPHIVRPSAREPFVLYGGTDRRDNFTQECACTCCRIEDEHTMNFLINSLWDFDLGLRRIREPVDKAEPVA